MEPSQCLLGGGGAAAGGGGTTGLSCDQLAKVEKDFLAEKEAELELGLGLSLGNSGGGGGGAAAKGKGCGWGEYGRILTAKDFPNGFSSGRAGAAGAGTKRERSGAAAADDEGCASPAIGQVVGWPPVRAYRMNTLFSQSKASNAEDGKGVGGNENNEQSKKKTNHGNVDKNDTSIKETRGNLGFVKVNMDGLPIGRKVDLNAHKSYGNLSITLEEMFFKSSRTIRGGKEQSMPSQKLLDGSSEFVLTYEDKEGDWMLVGDVPWRMFINTVKRLRIMRTSEANGLAPKFQERDEKQKGKPI